MGVQGIRCHGMRVLVILLLTLCSCARLGKSRVEPQATASIEAIKPTQEAPIQLEAKEVEDKIEETELTRLTKEGLRDIFFDFDEATIRPDARAILENNARWLKKNPRVKILIEGHCDERGTIEYNLALGDRRANAARDYLISLGIDPTRIATISYGEERPFAQGHNEEAWAQNRRAHFVIIAQ